MDADRYTTDWFSWNIQTWEKLFCDRRLAPTAYLEIGSWEGRSANFIAAYFPDVSLTCIDSWEDQDVEARFDRNLRDIPQLRKSRHVAELR